MTTDNTAIIDNVDTINNTPIFDIVGVGLGPFNLSLAALLAPVKEINSHFFESCDQFDWHPGLLLEDCTLQVPMMADLVTMADPTSHFSYLNYLHETARLYNFYFYEEFLIPRNDYNLYCRWVSEQLSLQDNNLHFGQRVTAINPTASGYQVTVFDQQCQRESVYHARHVVLGTGSVPSLPKGFEHLQGNAACVHSSDYLPNKAQLQQSRSITVVGAGQSAAEIVLDLLNEQDPESEHNHYEINWLTRSDGFLPMEYSKLGLEHFSPDYIDHFHALPEGTRDKIRGSQDLWYKGISSFTIAEIYDRVYRRTMGNKPSPLTLQARSELLSAKVKDDGGLKLTFDHRDNAQSFSFDTDKLVLATGHRHPLPSCLEPMMDHLEQDYQHRLKINRDYTLTTRLTMPGNIYIQNGELHSHGIGAPDLGLGAYRSASIVNHLLGEERYAMRQRNVFQNFGIAEKWQTNEPQKAPTGASESIPA